MTGTRRRLNPAAQHADPKAIRRRQDAGLAKRGGAHRGEEGPSRRRGGAAVESGHVASDRPRDAAGQEPEDPPQDSAPSAEKPAVAGAGDYLRAVAHEDAPDRFGTPPGLPDDHARRVWRTAFGLAVRRRFDPDSPLAEISRTAAAAVRLHESAALPPIEVEMLIRAELGEQVPVDELDPAVLVGVHLLVFASLVDELALRDGELDALVAQAEKLAGAR